MTGHHWEPYYFGSVITHMLSMRTAHTLRWFWEGEDVVSASQTRLPRYGKWSFIFWWNTVVGTVVKPFESESGWHFSLCDFNRGLAGPTACRPTSDWRIWVRVSDRADNENLVVVAISISGIPARSGKKSCQPPFQICLHNHYSWQLVSTMQCEPPLRPSRGSLLLVVESRPARIYH